MGAVPRPCGGGLSGNYFLGKLVEASLYAVLSWACVQYRWRCVSLEEKAHLGRPLVATPNNSLVLNTAWIAGRGDSEVILPIWPLTVDNRGRRLIPWPCLVH